MFEAAGPPTYTLEPNPGNLTTGMAHGCEETTGCWAAAYCSVQGDDCIHPCNPCRRR